MGNIDDRCYACWYCVNLNDHYHCLLARNEITNMVVAEWCDFFREDPYDGIHVNHAVERSIKENDQSLPNKE